MGRIRFWQNTVCKGAGLIRKNLREEGFNCMRLKQQGSRYSGSRGDLIINWGSQRDIPSSVVGNATLINNPSSIINASNKLRTFHILSGGGLANNIPDFTEEIEEAQEFVEEGNIIMCRTKLCSSKGRGIVVAEEVDQLVEAPLYTVYVEPSREVRLHVLNGSVISYAQKKRMGSERLEEEGIEVNPFIRSHDNGYVFAREGVEVPDEAKVVAIDTISALDLDFGSVDMVLNSLEVPIVLEVNTASGMTGSTVDAYVNGIKDILEGI